MKDYLLLLNSLNNNIVLFTRSSQVSDITGILWLAPPDARNIVQRRVWVTLSFRVDTIEVLTVTARTLDNDILRYFLLWWVGELGYF